MVVANNEIDETKNAGKSTTSHGDAAVRRGEHRPMKHIRGFTRSHWVPPSGEFLRHIAPAAAKINEFAETTQNTNKTQLLTSNYGTFRALVVCENFIPQNGPSTQLIDATSFVNVKCHDWS